MPFYAILYQFSNDCTGVCGQRQRHSLKKYVACMEFKAKEAILKILKHFTEPFIEHKLWNCLKIEWWIDYQTIFLIL